VKLGGFVCCWLVAAAAFGQANPQTGASIEGHVVNSITGEPLDKAVVQLNTIGSPGQNAAIAETDTQGRFSFSGVAAGRYQIVASRRGFLSQYFGSRKYVTRGTTISVARDQQLKDLVFRLNQQSVVSGRVLDEAGEPVEAARVTVLKLAYRDGERAWTDAGNGNTLDNGEFRIPRLEPGRYLVRAAIRAPARQSEVVSTITFYPNATDQTAATPVDIAPGAEVRGIEIRTVRAKMFHVRGKANPPPGPRPAIVSLMTKKGDLPEIRTAEAAPPEYLFDLPNVQSGSYILKATSYEDGGPFVTSQEIDIDSGDVNGIVLNLFLFTEIRGSLILNDESTHVDLSKTTLLIRTDVNALMRTDAGGAPRIGDDRKFTVRVRELGTLRFTVEVNGLPQDCFVSSIRYGGREVGGNLFEPVNGATLDIALRTDGGRIDGAVADKDGKPVENATVALIAKDGKVAARSVMTDESGKFQFNAIAPTDYELLAWEDIEPGAFQDPEVVKRFDTKSSAVTVTPHQRVTVQLSAVPAE
jgi:protocatechuate 3,4-dioxygenase beta subunit